MILTKQVRRFIKKFTHGRVRGGVQMQILCLMFIMFVLVFFRVMMDSQRRGITHDAVDDALVTALTSACISNPEEYGLSGALVIFDTVTPVREPDFIFSSITGQPPVDNTPFDTINDGCLYVAGSDSYLNDAYQRFIRNLKRNLKLDDAMRTTMSGIEGEVRVTEFSVYNKFYNLDEDLNQTDYRIVKYTYLPGSGWTVSLSEVNSPATCYNSIDHAQYTVDETSVSAVLEFEMVAATHTDEAGGQIAVPITYQRIVDVVR